MPATQRLFGGQIVGQALVAAARAVSRDEQVHSLHCYFVRTGAGNRGAGEPGGGDGLRGFGTGPAVARTLAKFAGVRRRRHPGPSKTGRVWVVLPGSAPAGQVSSVRRGQRQNVPFLSQGTPRCRCCTRWSGPVQGRVSLFAP